MPSIRYLGALLCVFVGAAAQAGTLTSATWLQVTQGVPMSRTTAQLGATGTSTASSIAVNLAYPQFTFSFFVPNPQPTSPINLHVKITQGGPQAITATPLMGNGVPGIPGTVIVMTALHIGMGINSSGFMVGPNTLVALPLDIGQAGVFMNTFSISGAPHYLTVDFFAWTPGMVTFTGLTNPGSLLPTLTASTLMATGSFNLNAAGGGTVTLVSPPKVSIDGAILQRRSASFSALKLNFVPEPGSIFLLGAAAAALVLARRR